MNILIGYCPKLINKLPDTQIVYWVVRSLDIQRQSGMGIVRVDLARLAEAVEFDRDALEQAFRSRQIFKEVAIAGNVATIRYRRLSEILGQPCQRNEVAIATLEDLKSLLQLKKQKHRSLTETVPLQQSLAFTHA